MMKNFLHSLFFLLLICLIPIGVNAKESSITIDFTKAYVDGKNIDQIQEEALEYLINSGEVTLLNNVDISKLEYGILFESKYQDTTFMGYANNDGKILLLFDNNNNNYIVPIGVGFNDNIHVTIDKSSNLKYDSIDVIFGEKKTKDKYLVLQLTDDLELTNISLKDTSVVKMLIDKNLLEEQDDNSFVNNKGKRLFSLNNQNKLIVERGLTYKDDIIYDLTKEDKELINEYLGINSNYKQIKLIVGNDSGKLLNSPKTFNIIVFPLAVLALSIVLMAFYIYKSKREN